MSGSLLLAVALGLASSPERLRDKACKAQIEELAAVAEGPAPAAVTYARTLRHKVLENPGPSHRAHARRALAKLLHLRLGSAGTTSEGCADADAPLLAAEVAAIAPSYALADQGVAGAVKLREALKATGATPAETAGRAVAAHALSLTGVIPDQAMIDELLGVIGRESDPVARLEEVLALAAYAQRSKAAFAALKTLLLAEKDCAFAEAAAVSLPGEDLRYRLFHGVGAKAGRPAQIRKWVRAKAAAGCGSA